MMIIILLKVKIVFFLNFFIYCVFIKLYNSWDIMNKYIFCVKGKKLIIKVIIKNNCRKFINKFKVYVEENFKF